MIVSFESASHKGAFFLGYLSSLELSILVNRCIERWDPGFLVGCAWPVTAHLLRRDCAAALCGDLSGAQKVESFPVMQVECWKCLFRYTTSARCECVGDFAFVFFDSCPTCLHKCACS